MALDAVLREYAELVGEHDLRRQVIVSCDLRKRVVLVRERLFEMDTGLADEVLDGLVGYLTAQRERVDHHTDGVGHLEVATAVGDGGDAQVVGVRKTCERVEDGCECRSGRGDTGLLR